MAGVGGVRSRGQQGEGQITVRVGAIAMGVITALGIWHAWSYRFLCDDAFISFRYARNLSHGAGLVFNPGLGRVEGFTNFLWVLLLAVFDRFGVVPERAALVLSFVASVGLFGLVAWWARRGAGGRSWVWLTPALLLASTRSVAVWSTSGLETRAFELLVVAGVLRVCYECEAFASGGEPRRAVGGWLFAIAELMRPDALVVGLPVLLAAAWYLRRLRGVKGWVRATFVPLVIIVGLHILFRWSYFGDWLPNTYYAKVAGRARWSWGARYLAAWAIEYGVAFWLPLIAVALMHARRAGRTHIPLLFAAALGPWVGYIVAIGGDHFEYRILGLMFPLSYLWVGDGLAALREMPKGRWLVPFSFAAILVSLWVIPRRSHLDFPSEYMSGFPGLAVGNAASRDDYLAPERDPLLRLPVIRAIARIHQRLTRELTSHFVAIRQEEHARFLRHAETQGHRLRALVDAGLLPRDTRVAIDCIGAIPYRSGLLVLDRHGLTDKVVAHQKPAVLDLMAHEKVAGLDDARRFGVELWAVDPVDLVVEVTSERLLFAMTHTAEGSEAAFAAAVSDSEYLLAVLPPGVESVAARTPMLRWNAVLDSSFAVGYLARAVPAFENKLTHDPADLKATNALAFLYLVQGRHREALDLYSRLSSARPTDELVWAKIAELARSLQRPDEERAALLRLFELARIRRDDASAARVWTRYQQLQGRGGPRP